MKHKILHSLILLLLCIGPASLYAQQDADAAGGDATGTGGTASYSIGQVAYTYVSGTNGSSNQGVQQPYEFFSTGIDEAKDISLSITVYPNPTWSLVNLKVESANHEDMDYELYDISGKLLSTQTIYTPLTIVPMQSLAAGSYLLKVTGAGKALRSFTIIKIN